MNFSMCQYGNGQLHLTIGGKDYLPVGPGLAVVLKRAPPFGNGLAATTSINATNHWNRKERTVAKILRCCI